MTRRCKRQLKRRAKQRRRCGRNCSLSDDAEVQPVTIPLQVDQDMQPVQSIENVAEQLPAPVQVMS